MIRPVDENGFSAEAWTRNAAAYEAIRTMPFNAELAAGTLGEARFRHYILQDAHYLIGFGRALALAAAKSPEPEGIVQFAKAAETAILVERSLHGGFFRDYGISAETFAATPLSPPCDHYVSYLLATAYGEPYEVLVAALLPCFWIYAEIGTDILRVVEQERELGVSQDRAELAQAAYERLCQRYGYQRESVRDALSELLTRRYQH
jgi:thiaminase/transcriptional activator TenA